MAGKGSVMCAKCGTSSKEKSSLTFHRFPLPSAHGSLKAKVWAKFCYPDGDWTSDEKLYKLYKQHKMLCGKHFNDSSFTSIERKRLNKYAIPTEAQNILAQLREEHLHQSSNTMETQCSVSALKCIDVQSTANLKYTEDEECVEVETCDNITDEGEPEKPGEETLGEERRLEYRCNVCEKEIIGSRYCCIQCSDYDMCAECEASGKHTLHYVLRIPNNKSQHEVVAVIERLRAELRDGIWTTHPDDEISVKKEVIEVQEQNDPLTAMYSKALRQEDSAAPYQEKPASCQAESSTHLENQLHLYCIPEAKSKMKVGYDYGEEDDENDYKDIEYLEDIISDLETDQRESEQMVSVGVSRPRRRIKKKRRKNILRRTLKQNKVELFHSGPHKTDMHTMRRPEHLKRTNQRASVNENLKRLKSRSAVPTSDVENKPTVRFTPKIMYIT